MAEGLSYMAGAELPCLIMNVVVVDRIGNNSTCQGDYLNCKGGHGDYKCLSLTCKFKKCQILLNLDLIWLLNKIQL